MPVRPHLTGRGARGIPRTASTAFPSAPLVVGLSGNDAELVAQSLHVFDIAFLFGIYPDMQVERWVPWDRERSTGSGFRTVSLEMGDR